MSHIMAALVVSISSHMRQIPIDLLTFWIMRSTANSAQMVFPDPVGAAIKQLSSDWYNALKTCTIDLILQLQSNA